MIEAMLKGLALGSLLAISVGPVIFTVLKQSIVNGKEGGLSFVAGVWLSDILLIFICNAFSEMVNLAFQYQRTIGLVGALFLTGLGVFYVFFKKRKLQPEVGGTLAPFKKRDFAKIFSSGFLINSLNPAVLLFWITSAATFSIKHTWNERLLIFAVCMSLNISADIVKVFLAGKIRSRLNTGTIAAINKISGSILILFGVALFWGTFTALTKN